MLICFIHGNPVNIKAMYKKIAIEKLLFNIGEDKF